jgi:hypothetical protein
MLVVVWHLLTKEEADCYSSPEQVACAFFAFFYKVGARRMPAGTRALEYTRQQLDRLRIGQELQAIRWGRKRYQLPPSSLPAPDAE